MTFDMNNELLILKFRPFRSIVVICHQQILAIEESVCLTNEKLNDTLFVKHKLHNVASFAASLNYGTTNYTSFQKFMERDM